LRPGRIGQEIGIVELLVERVEDHAGGITVVRGEVPLQLVDDTAPRIAVVERAADIERVSIVEDSDLAPFGRKRPLDRLLLNEICGNRRTCPGRFVQTAVDDDRLADPDGFELLGGADGREIDLRRCRADRHERQRDRHPERATATANDHLSVPAVAARRLHPTPSRARRLRGFVQLRPVLWVRM